MDTAVLERIKGKRLADIIKLPPPPWMFDGLIRDKSVGALISPPHAAKSVLMLDMAICLDYGLPLFGKFRPIRRDHKPFIFSVDGPDWDMGRIAHKLMIGHGLTAEQRDLCNIVGRWHRGLRVLDPAFWNPNKPKSCWLGEWAEEFGITTLFIDTKISATMVNENNALEAEMVNEHLKSMRDILGISVVYLHHTAKPSMDGARAAIHAGRGSSADPGAADWQIVLNRVPRPQGGSRVMFDWAKSRGDFPPKLDYVDMIPIPTQERDPAGGPLTGLRFLATQMEREEALLHVLKTPSTREQMIRTLEIQGDEQQKYKLLDNILQKLRREGLIESDGRGTWRIK